jgi:uronate dehydrogenase
MSLREQIWVLTGAAGRIGRALREGLRDEVKRLRLVDIVPLAPQEPQEEAVTADIRDAASLEPAFAGAQGVIHLAGLADEADFHDLCASNIVATFHVLEAARRAGVARVVYASSNRVTGFYPTTVRVAPAMPPRPDGLYGVSKLAGEALCRLYVDKFGLAAVCIRIGSYEPQPLETRHLSTWLSPRDSVAAFRAAMTAPSLGFATFYGVSANTQGWWDLEAGSALGFHPQDNAEDHASGIAVAKTALVQGGDFAAASYTLDRQRRPR